MPAVVVDTWMVADEQRFSTAEVVTDLREAATQTDRQVVAVWSHLFLTDPEQQTVTGTRTDVQSNIQLATSRSTTSMITGAAVSFSYRLETYELNDVNKHPMQASIKQLSE